MKDKFSTQVMGGVNSAINPLLATMVSIDELIQEESHKPEKFSRLLFIDQQIQRSVECFLELRSIVMLNHEHELYLLESAKPNKTRQNIREFIIAILIGANIGIMVSQVNMIFHC